MPRTPAQKARRRELAAAKQYTDLERAQQRIAVLEKAGAHWYAVGKSTGEACKQCGLFLADRIHRDSYV